MKNRLISSWDLRHIHKESTLKEKSLNSCRKSFVRDKYGHFSIFTDFQNPSSMNRNALIWAQFWEESVFTNILTVGERAMSRGMKKKDKKLKIHFYFFCNMLLHLIVRFQILKCYHRTVNFIYLAHSLS